MFAKKSNRKKLASNIAKYLSNHKDFKTHSRHIDREQARKKGLVIENLESDQVFQDLILSIYHATSLTLATTPAVKIVENQLGKAFIKQVQQVIIQGPPPGAKQTPPQNPPKKT